MLGSSLYIPVTYLCPTGTSFRHGFAVYSIQQANDLSIFSNIDVQRKIAGLGNGQQKTNQSTNDLIKMLKLTIEQLENEQVV